MSDEMLVAIDLLTLELGHVTDGEGVALEDEAIIFFKEDVDCTCEIRVSSPGAQTIAAKIVETWNNRPQSLTPAQQTRDTGWLIEWPEDDNVPVRWWNPSTGWMRDANKAMRFCREADAADYLAAGHWAAGIKPTEHVFLSAPSAPSPIMQSAERALKQIDSWSDSKREYADRVTGGQTFPSTEEKSP